MAKITNGGSFGLNAPQAMAARMMAEGKTEDYILLVLFKVRDGVDDPKEVSKARRTLHKWQRLPGFAECYRAIVKEIAMPSYGRAVARITAQIDDPNAWVAQGAAREVLTRFGPVVMGTDSAEVVVRVEGMPELGTPDEGGGG